MNIYQVHVRFFKIIQEVYMISKYVDVSIIYGGTGRKYAAMLKKRIDELAENERYPVSACIIMESILTRDLLSDVMRIFRDSEICVAFLTPDDISSDENGKRKRLRQNVVFEIGMAMMELGRENCILLSNFDTKSPDFELPSDMNGLEIMSFSDEDLPSVIEKVVEKVLDMSRSFGREGKKNIPQYDNLLTREKYRVDFENIFFDSPGSHFRENGNIKDILKYWLSECGSFSHYDEKALYMFERIGFLPVFDKIPEAREWLIRTAEMLESYSESDIEYYNDTRILDFTRNLVECIINYTGLKTLGDGTDLDRYRALLDDFLSEPYLENTVLNPLISVVYYDYLGLTYMRLFRIAGNVSDIETARGLLEKALEYSDKVDMSCKIWGGFIMYNLARTYAFQEETEKAARYYKKAIKIRKDWLKYFKNNVTVRNAVSSEYFIAKLDYLDMCKKYRLEKKKDIKKEYDDLEKELDVYCDKDERLEKLSFIRTQLNLRKTEW